MWLQHFGHAVIGQYFSIVDQKQVITVFWWDNERNVQIIWQNEKEILNLRMCKLYI